MTDHDPLVVSDHCDECGNSEPECDCEETMLNFKDPTWAHAELFGHSSYFGRVREVTFCGAAGLAIEPLIVDGFLPEFFAAGSAIFRLTPMSEDDVRHAVLPRAYRACEAFQASRALATNCRVCGHNEQEHAEEQQRKALPILIERSASVIPDALFEGEDDDIPFESRLDATIRHVRSVIEYGGSAELGDLTVQLCDLLGLRPLVSIAAPDALGDAFEDEELLAALSDHLLATARHANEAQAIMIRSGHDKIELIRAPLASATDEPIGERVRKALEGTPVANADLLAATLRAPVGVVSTMLQEMGWTSDGHGLWMRPERLGNPAGVQGDAARPASDTLDEERL